MSTLFYNIQNFVSLKLDISYKGRFYLPTLHSIALLGYFPTLIHRVSASLTYLRMLMICLLLTFVLFSFQLIKKFALPFQFGRCARGRGGAGRG